MPNAYVGPNAAMAVRTWTKRRIGNRFTGRSHDRHRWGGPGRGEHGLPGCRTHLGARYPGQRLATLHAERGAVGALGLDEEPRVVPGRIGDEDGPRLVEPQRRERR